ncbi:TNT domain-containing protein [Mycolicibacterium chlorophenolicum]|uniref:TNT domain-containing protein n=1 Tax=Mycolicibacterium chlorophenolicum TaxID=37916 RepID=A0A0J6WH14_9MYCO|nr:TNT domain-containing protein [Mycolicibacterium chlorophenolicum]KMO82520.1 hypothetical protein MCHLDSM_01143 [Mycolicibacterium chlorophenolicum]
MGITLEDVQRWEPSSIRDMFRAATEHGAAAHEAADTLTAVMNAVPWDSEAADAARAGAGKVALDLRTHARECELVARAAAAAEEQVAAVKREWEDITSYAAEKHLDIDLTTGAVTFELAGLTQDQLRDRQAAQREVRDRIHRMMLKAVAADQELATAIKVASGQESITDAERDLAARGVPSADSVVRAVTGADPPGDAPHSLTDMLLPAGGSAGGLDQPADLHDLLLGPGAPDPKGKPGDQPADLSGALDQVAGAHVPEASKAGDQPANLSAALDQLAGAPVPDHATPMVIPAKDVEAFKAAARPILASQGVPADQIESRLSQMVAQAEAQGVNPFYRPPEPARMPAPGFGEGFGDAWRNSEQSIKNLLGQGGPGAPGVLESWKNVAQGVNQAVTNPVGTAVGQVQHALDSPSAAYFAGEKTFDLSAAAATAPFGGEGAAVRAGLPAELVTEGGAPLAVMRGWDPMGGMSAQDFQNLFGTPGARNWPGNDGFPPGYVPQPAHLPEGTIIDRFGSEYGQYLSPDGTPYSDRAITPETLGGEYNRYMVTGAPLPSGWRIVEGPVEPWFGQTPSPGALQYMVVGPEGTRISVNDLLEKGIIERAGPPLGR